jgi:hypothetical protein
MNSLIEGYYPVFQMYQSLRDQLMELVTDTDLSFRPGERNLSLGGLCREIGQVQRSYIDSFKTGHQDFSNLTEDSRLESSAKELAVWFGKLDQELEAVIAGFSEEELETKTIDRGGGFVLSPRIQLEVYKEALLIFYGKTSVYLQQMGKSLPKQWQEWIG